MLRLARQKNQNFMNYVLYFRFENYKLETNFRHIYLLYLVSGIMDKNIYQALPLYFLCLLKSHLSER